jgi:acyl-homoserine lactone synthase
MRDLVHSSPSGASARNVPQARGGRYVGNCLYWAAADRRLVSGPEETPMQIKIVQPEERWQFSRPMMEMHRHRKQIFVDRLGWDLPNRGSWLEVDEFDNEHAVYIMVTSADGSSHLGSVRLLPTSLPHMLSTVFADLCPGGLPAGDKVWEISRLVATPEGADGRNVLRIHRLLAHGIVEFGLLNRIERFTLVADSHRLPALLSIGWKVLPLSLPTKHGDSVIEAAEILVNQSCLDHIRRRAGLEGRVCIPADDLRTAA